MAHFDKAIVGAEKWLMQLGTLSGNPVAVGCRSQNHGNPAASGQYERLRELGQTLMDMQSEALTEQGIAHRICGDPTLFDIYFTDVDPVDYRSAKHSDPKINEVWNKTLRANGVFKSPGKLYPSLALVTVNLFEVHCRIRHLSCFHFLGPASCRSLLLYIIIFKSSFEPQIEHQFC
jgi:glutamate-1-semialdehyde 2,1-aminomutase